MSTNLATILVGLGYDLSALEKGAPEAFRLINQQTLGMSSEMKRTSREGAEAWRLIDEALGIHVSRPLTRIVTREFPAFASALQSVLGAGVVGALAVAGVEFFDKITKKIEEARAAQEKYAEASKAADETIRNVLGGIDKKILELTSKDHTLRIRLQGAEEARAGIDQISKSLEEMEKAGEKANSLTTWLAARFGDFSAHIGEGFVDIADLLTRAVTLSPSSPLHDEIYGSPAFNNMKQTLKDMKDAFNEALNADRLKGTHEALELAQKDIQIATAYLHDMQNAGDKAGISLAQSALKFYQSSLDVEKGTAKLEGIEQQKEAAAALVAFYSEIRGATGKIEPATNPLVKLEAELDAARAKAIADFGAIRDSGATAVQLDRALAQLHSFEAELDRTRAAAIATADAVKAQAAASTAFAAALAGKTPVAPFALPTTAVTPQLGAGGTSAAQFDVFAKDQVAQLKLAAQAYQELQTPQQAYNLKHQELNLLLEKGLIDQASYTAALQHAREEMAKATDQLEKLLEKTDSAAAGAKAFFLQLESQGGKSGTGTFTFELLNKGLQGFEDETVKALTGAKTNWKSFFESLDQMALKFALNKEFANLFKMLGDSSVGKSLGLGNLIGTANPTQIANTTALTANTTVLGVNTGALVANTAALAAAAAGSAVASGGSLGAFLGGAAFPGYASGTDYAPGGMAWVGENGPELLNLPAGSSVTPSQALRFGSPTVHVNIDARGAQMGVAEQIARSWQQHGPELVLRSVVEAYERTRRSLSNS